MNKIIFDNSGDITEAAENGSIADACQEQGVPFACSEGVCGTCIIEVLEGGQNLTSPTEQELDFLGEEGVKRERMACQCGFKKECSQEAYVKLRF